MVSDAFGEVIERLRRSTVQVQAGGNGCGSGVVWSADGQIVTNAHVLHGGRTQVELWNGRRSVARVLKSDPRRDLALLRIEAEGLPIAARGDSASLRPGELVIAVGSPFGFIGAVSTGVIHSVGPLHGFEARPWVVSDVKLAPGNSGGPLANARGEVVGLNTMIAGGLALAIPSKSVAQFLERPDRGQARLGVTIRPVPMERNFLGFLVLEITPQSPAERASLLPGDLLVGAADKPFRFLEDLEDALDSSREGPLEIEFRRGASLRTRRVVAQIARESVRAA
jgi:serine protease Do